MSSTPLCSGIDPHISIILKNEARSSLSETLYRLMISLTFRNPALRLSVNNVMTSWSTSCSASKLSTPELLASLKETYFSLRALPTRKSERPEDADWSQSSLLARIVFKSSTRLYFKSCYVSFFFPSDSISAEPLFLSHCVD